MKQDEEIGKRFGRLTVVARRENSASGKRRFECSCSCGGRTVAVISKLRSGSTASCGCLQREVASRTGRSRVEDLQGRRFGRLLVVFRAEGMGLSKPCWVCACTCGKTTRVQSSNLKNGSTKSCGCLSAENSRRRMTVHGLSFTPQYAKEKSRRRNERMRHDPLAMVTRRARDLVRRAVRGSGRRKDSKTQELLGCTYEEFRRHIEMQFTRGMSWEKFNRIHIDHIIPLATAKSPSDVRRLSHYSNLQPLWASENLRKGARLNWHRQVSPRN